MKDTKNIFPFTIFIFLLSLGACKHDVVDKIEVSEVCSEDTVYFQEQVLPIFKSCASAECHSVEDHQENLILVDYFNIYDTAQLIPGNPDESEIYEAMISTGDDRMPPEPYEPLSQYKTDLVYKWIQQGGLNNSCPDIICDTLEVTFVDDIFPIVDGQCTFCHSGNDAQGGVDMSNYDLIANVIEDDSEYFLNLISEEAAEPMPYNTNGLPDCQIRMFEIWIAAGMPNN